MAANGMVVPANLLRNIHGTYMDFHRMCEWLHNADERIQDRETFDEFREAIQAGRYAVSDAFSAARATYMRIQDREDTLPPDMVTKIMNLMGKLIQEPENESEYEMFPDRLPMALKKAILKVSNADGYAKFRSALPDAIYMATRFASEWEGIYLIARDHAQPEEDHENYPAGGFRYKKRTLRKKRTHRKGGAEGEENNVRAVSNETVKQLAKIDEQIRVVEAMKKMVDQLHEVAQVCHGDNWRQCVYDKTGVPMNRIMAKSLSDAISVYSKSYATEEAKQERLIGELPENEKKTVMNKLAFKNTVALKRSRHYVFHGGKTRGHKRSGHKRSYRKKTHRKRSGHKRSGHNRKRSSIRK